MLPGPLEIGYRSSEPHVMEHNVIASLVLKLHEEKYIKFDDLASPDARQCGGRGSQGGRQQNRGILMK